MLRDRYSDPSFSINSPNRANSQPTKGTLNGRVGWVLIVLLMLPASAHAGWKFAGEVSLAEAYNTLYSTDYETMGSNGLFELVADHGQDFQATWTSEELAGIQVLVFDTSVNNKLYLNVGAAQILLYNPGPWTPDTHGWLPDTGSEIIDIESVLVAHGHPADASFSFSLNNIAMSGSNTYQINGMADGQWLFGYNDGGLMAGDKDANEPILLAIAPPPSPIQCSDPAGDLNGDGITNNCDLNCMAKAVKWAALGGQQAPKCLAVPEAADLNCDGVVDMADMKLELTLVLTGSLPDALDTDGDACADTCQLEDSDGDGDPDINDCEPNDATVYTGAVELCNGIDDNCDGNTDEDFNLGKACVASSPCGYSNNDVPAIVQPCVEMGQTVCNSSGDTMCEGNGKTIQTVWQLGQFDFQIAGAKHPAHEGAAEFSDTPTFSKNFSYKIIGNGDPAPAIPGYLYRKKFAKKQATKKLHLHFWLDQDISGAQIHWSRYGSETNSLSLDGTVLFKTSVQEKINNAYNVPVGDIAAGHHVVTLTYLGKGKKSGNYMDAIRLVAESSKSANVDICGNGLDDDCNCEIDEETQTAELCDGNDNNCDGTVDEGFGLGNSCLYNPCGNPPSSTTPDVFATAGDKGLDFPTVLTGDSWALIGTTIADNVEHKYKNQETLENMVLDLMLSLSGSDSPTVLGFFGAYDKADLAGALWLFEKYFNEGYLADYDGMDISSKDPLDLTPADLEGVDIVVLDAAPDAPSADFFVLTAGAYDALKAFQASGGVIIGSAYTMVHWTNYYGWKRKLANEELSQLFGGSLPDINEYSHKAETSDGDIIWTLTAAQPKLPTNKNPFFHAFWKLIPGSIEGPPLCTGDGTLVCSADESSAECAGAPLGGPAELCGNGQDDNCNCEIDEGFETLSQVCSEGVGACASEGAMVCTDDALALECTAVAGTPAGPANVCSATDDECSGNIMLLDPPPASADHMQLESNVGASFWYEQQSVTTESPTYVSILMSNPSVDLTFDGTHYVFESGVASTQNSWSGDLPSGVYDSFFIHADKNGPNQTFQFSLTFDQPIVAIVYRNHPEHQELLQSDGLFGALGTTYAGGGSQRGHELDGPNNWMRVSEDGHTLSVHMVVAHNMDDIRIITSSDGADVDKPAPWDNLCNGIDDDCDGEIDEDFKSTATSCGVGACSMTGVTSCVDGEVVDSCVPGVAADNDAGCDGVDDNCNGDVDEEYESQATQCGTGACEMAGKTSCSDGFVMDSCMPGKAASDDTSCDGIDDNCNGESDEDYQSVASTCGTGGCAADGQSSCEDGQILDNCEPGDPASDDSSCDEVDSDCDGQVDEDCPDGNCQKTLDFDLDANGNAIVAGQPLNDVYAEWGVSIDVWKSEKMNSAGLPIAFNSSKPTGGDWDLGTPNVCFGGPGKGSGGKAGMPGANAKSLGNLLISAENTCDANKDGLVDNPDDDAGGAVFEFNFATSTCVDSLDLIDIEVNEAAVNIYLDGPNTFAQMNVDGLGDNSVQTVTIGTCGVTKMRVVIHSSGALDNLVFCSDAPACEQSQTAVSDAETLADGSAAIETWDDHPFWTAEVPGGAQWIWNEYYVSQPKIDVMITFERTLTLPEDATDISGSLILAADNSYAVWVNGVLVGQDITETNYFIPDTINLTDLLNAGENSIVFEVLNWAQPWGNATSNPAGLRYNLTTHYWASGTLEQCGL